MIVSGLTNQPDRVASSADDAYARYAPHLWPWAGWYALVVGDRFVGVFPDLDGAGEAALAITADATVVFVCRIGGDSAVAAPPADGGLLRLPRAA